MKSTCLHNKKVALLIITFFFFSCSNNDSRLSDSFFSMDTYIEVIAYTNNKDSFDSFVEAIKMEGTRLEKLFSTTTGESELRAINGRSGGLTAYVSGEQRHLLQKALYYCNETDGLFDISIAPIKFLWGFGTGQTPLFPDSLVLRRTLALVNWRNINLCGDSVCFSDSSVKIDLGGIAKGYALSRFAAFANKLGISSYLVNAGGDIIIGNPKPDGSKWKIGIKHPRKGGEPIKVLELNNTSVVTSGDYERFTIIDNKRYHHIFNPATGFPANGIISATVVADDPVKADVYSTVMVVRSSMTRPQAITGVQKIILINDSLEINEFGYGDHEK